MDKSEQRHRLSLRELQHRVRNILANVRSLATQTVRESHDLAEFQESFEGRLNALARTENLLTGPERNRVDLAELVLEELLTHTSHPDRNAEVEGPDLLIRDRAAPTLALAFHELASNAVKFGALAADNGHVSVRWRIEERDGEPHLVLEWRESGVEIEGEVPVSDFGRGLIERAVPYHLGGRTKLEFGRQGCRCVMEIPFDGIIERAKSGDQPPKGAQEET